MALSLEMVLSERSLGIVGVLLALFFGGVAIYTEFIRQDAPALRFETLTDAGVLDVKEQIADLQITYKGVDIEKTGKALRVAVIRVSNVGRDSVTINDYDPKLPLGVSISQGELVRGEVIATSNDYLRASLSVTLASTTVTFTPVIWDPRDSATIKLLILHDRSQRPRILPIGKIARVGTFEQVDETADQGAFKSFLSKAFGGGFWIHLARLGAYAFAFVLSLIALIATTEWLGGRRNKKKTRAFVTTLLSGLSPQQRSLAEPLVAFIDKNGLRLYRVAARLLVDEKALQEAARRLGSEPKPEHLWFVGDVDASHPAFTHNQRFVLERMIEAGLVKIVDGSAVVAPGLVEIARESLKRRKKLDRLIDNSRPVIRVHSNHE